MINFLCRHLLCTYYLGIWAVAVMLTSSATADEGTPIGLSEFWQSQQDQPKDAKSLKISATVTYHDPVSGFAFIQDGNHGDFLCIKRSTLIPPGTRIQIEASYQRSCDILSYDPKRLAILNNQRAASVAKIVPSHKLPRLHLSKLTCRLIKTSAKVIHFEGWDTHTAFSLDAGRGEIVQLMIPTELTPAVAKTTARWVGKTIDFEAVVGLTQNSIGEATGTTLFAASLDQITIASPNAVPPDSRSSMEAGSQLEEPFHLTGVVTLITDKGIVVQGEGIGTFVNTRSSLMVTPNKSVDVIASGEATAIRLHTLRLHGDQKPKPLIVSSMRSLANANSQLISCSGIVESFETVGDSIVVLLNDGHRRFAVSVPGTLSEFAEVAIHSALNLEATGVCSLPNSPLFDLPERWTNRNISCLIRARSVDDLLVSGRRSTLPVSYVA